MEREIVNTDKAPQAIGPYSQAVVAGSMLFVSGQIPLDPKTGSIIQGDIKMQTRQVMENAGAILAAGGASYSTVVKTTIYLKNMSDFGAVNEVYAGYFPADPPARATIQAAGLPKDVGVEIDFVALKV